MEGFVGASSGVGGSGLLFFATALEEAFGRPLLAGGGLFSSSVAGVAMPLAERLFLGLVSGDWRWEKRKIYYLKGTNFCGN